MLQLMVGTNIPFMKFRRFAYVFSGILLALTLAWFFAKGPRYSVDFTGGTMLQIRLSPAVHPDKLREALQAAHIDAELQQMTGESQNEYLIRFRTDADPVKLVGDAITANLPGVAMELRGNATVGPKVGSDLRSKAFWAILTSLGAILLYVGIRYEFKFALGGVVALVPRCDHHLGSPHADRARGLPDRGGCTAHHRRLLDQRHHRGVRPHP